MTGIGSLVAIRRWSDGVETFGNVAKRQTASTYLQTLAGLGILREQKHGREKYYINEALFNELAS